MDEELGQFLSCPITGTIISNPVTLTDGHVYEKDAIETWLKTHNTSPMTNVKLQSKIMIPIHSLKCIIGNYRKVYPAELSKNYKIKKPTDQREILLADDIYDDFDYANFAKLNIENQKICIDNTCIWNNTHGGHSLMITIFRDCSEEIMKCVLEKSLDFTHIFSNNSTILHYTCLNKNITLYILRRLISMNIDLNVRNTDGETALFNLCSNINVNLTMINMLIYSGANINVMNNYGNNLLHVLCNNKSVRVEMIKYFINSGLNVNCVNDEKHNLLHVICNNEHRNTLVIECLIKSGINVNQMNIYGNTPLSSPGMKKYIDIDVIELLINAGADINVEFDDGSTILHIMCTYPIINIGLIQKLINAGANVNHQNKNGITPLSYACINKNKKLIKLLILNGAQLNMAKYFYFSALEVIKQQNYGLYLEIVCYEKIIRMGKIMASNIW